MPSVGAGFRNLTFAEAELPVIKNKDGDIQIPMKKGKIFQAMTYIAGVTVKPEKSGVYLGIGGRHEPTVQTGGVSSREKDILVG
ncbi:MAG: hypothetical protein P8X67_17210 [Syntrophobacterales bacterium]